MWPFKKRRHQTTVPTSAIKAAAPTPMSQEPQQPRVKILHDKNITIEYATRRQRLEVGRVIEEKMLAYRNLPFQICNCEYFGDGCAIAAYNMNNKQILEAALNHLTCLYYEVYKKEKYLRDIFQTQYNFEISKVNFDFPPIVSEFTLPQSYIVYYPETKSGKTSKYPLIAYFNTVIPDTVGFYDERYSGELYYAVNGDLSKAVIMCHKNGKHADITFSVVGCTLTVSKIKIFTTDYKWKVIYDCMHELTDYKDFADS